MPIPDAPAYLVPDGDDVLLMILAQPKSSRNAVADVVDGRLKIRLKAPPVDGAANKELIAFLAKTLSVPKSGLEIVSGHTGRRKTVRVSGLSIQDVKERLP